MSPWLNVTRRTCCWRNGGCLIDCSPTTLFHHPACKLRVRRYVTPDRADDTFPLASSQQEYTMPDLGETFHRLESEWVTSTYHSVFTLRHGNSACWLTGEIWRGGANVSPTFYLSNQFVVCSECRQSTVTGCHIMRAAKRKLRHPISLCLCWERWFVCSFLKFTCWQLAERVESVPSLVRNFASL